MEGGREWAEDADVEVHPETFEKAVEMADEGGSDAESLLILRRLFDLGLIAAFSRSLEESRAAEAKGRASGGVG